MSFLASFKAHATKNSAEVAEKEAWSRYCHALLASNEFLYLR
jgi:hypothetical protein